jgi:hypothetical protein
MIKSSEMPRIQSHAVPFQKLLQFLSEAQLKMVFFLTGNVIPDSLAMCVANGERRIALLPLKKPVMVFRRPIRRRFLQLAEEIRKTMGCLKTHEEVNVIVHAADAFGNSSQTADGAAEIFMHLRAPRMFDEWSPFFCAEDDMIVEV